MDDALEAVLGGIVGVIWRRFDLKQFTCRGVLLVTMHGYSEETPYLRLEEGLKRWKS